MCLQIEFVFADGLRQTVEAAEVPCRHPTRLPGPNNRCIHDFVRLRIEVDCPSPYGRDLPTTIRLPSQRLYEWEECEEKMVSAVTVRLMERQSIAEIVG